MSPTLAENGSEVKAAPATAAPATATASPSPSPTGAPTLTQVPFDLPTGVPAATSTPIPPKVASPSATATRTVVPTPPPAPTSGPVATPAPIAAPAQASQGTGANTRLLKVEAGSVGLGDSQGVAKDAEVIRLDKQADGQFAAKGVLLSEQHQADFPFNDAVFSWNAEAPAGTQLEFQLRVGADGQMSPWFTMGTWSATGGASGGGQGNAWGSVDVDTLELKTLAKTFQYRVTFTTSNPAASPRLRSVAVVYSNLNTPLSGPKPVLLDGWARDLEVPRYSQLEEDPSVARTICSPTSLTMVLRFWGQGESVKDVYRGVKDGRAGIFGNWPLNTAYAGALGYDAYVDRFYSVEQLQNEIAQGRPVIISIRFQPGQLDNSPISSTSGHLIVVRGFTPQGDVIVNDPIASSSSRVRLVYKRDQLFKIWRDSGGIVYLVKPR